MPSDWLQKGLVGRYRIERELGRGGIATVFLARDLVHDRLVAIKVTHRDVAAGFIAERFLREIRVLATLQHPNILPLHDSGAVDGVPYYVMPFVAGESLRDRLTRDGPLTVSLAVRFATEAASALDYAHRQGVIHRDIKPENILLSDEHVVIADFGIARAAAQSADDRLTGTSVAIGTLAYMSPEQAMGETNLNGRSDLYSLACVTFEMLTGRTPFTGTSAAAIVASRFAKTPPRVSSLRPDVPRNVDDAIAAGLTLSPEGRPSTGEFAGMLSGETIPSRGSRYSAGRKLALLSILAVLIVVAGFVLWRTARNQPAGVNTGARPTRSIVAHGTSNVAAHELYLKGKKVMEGVPSSQSAAEALRSFEKAVALDSQYAQAWAAIGEIHTGYGVGNFASVPPRPEFEEARFAANHALALDSTLAEAHAVLGLVQMMYDYDWDGSLASLRRARALDPGYEQTYLYEGFLFSWRAEYDSALASNREALRMTPTSERIRQDFGRILILARRFKESEAALREGVARDSANGRMRMLLGECLMAAGRSGEAVAELEHAHRILPDASRVTAFLIAAYSRAGRPDAAHSLLDSLSATSQRSFVAAMDFAIAFAGLRDTTETITWLERAYDDRTLRPFMRDPVFDFLAGEPRYKALFAKMRLTLKNSA